MLTITLIVFIKNFVGFRLPSPSEFFIASAENRPLFLVSNSIEIVCVPLSSIKTCGLLSLPPRSNEGQKSAFNENRK
jgi:hypothetical protein